MASLPRLIVIADVQRLRDDLHIKVRDAVASGARWILLRDTAHDDRRLECIWRDACRVAAGQACGHPSDIPRGSRSVAWSIGRRAGLAARLGLGVHFAAHQQATSACRIVGQSIHHETEATQAVNAGVHYVVAGTIYPSRSKPGHPGMGLRKLAALCAMVHPTPVFAIGGITPARCAPVLQAGAHGVAVCDAVFAGDHVARDTAVLLQALMH